MFSCTVSGDPKGSPTNDPTPGESSSLPSDPDTIEPDDDPSESESDDPEEIDGDDIVPAANTGVTFIPAGNVPSGSTPTCDLDPSACEPNRPPGAGVDICEIRPDLAQCQEPEPTPTLPPDDGETTPPDDGDDDCFLGIGLLCPPDNGDGDGDGDGETSPTPVMRDVNCKDVSTTALKLSWQAAKDDKKDDIAYYTIRGNRGIGEYQTTSLGGEFTGLEPDTEYRFDVWATDGDGNESERVEKQCTTDADTQGPTMPSDLKVVHITSTTADLAWEPSKDNSRVDHYEVTWTSPNGDSEGSAETDGTTFYVTDLDPETNYTFSVVAVDIVGNPSPSASVDGTTLVDDTDPPEVPANVEVVKVGDSTLRVSWNASADNQSRASAIEYDIRISGVALANGSVTGETSYTTDYLDLLPGTITAEVTATDEAGNTSEAGSGELTLEEQRQAQRQAPGVRSQTQDPSKSGAPSGEAPAEKPTDEKSPELPGLGDILPGGEDSAEAPAEKPAEPEAEPSESETPAARPTTEEPAEEPTEKSTEDAPAEEDKGLLESIGDAVTTAVAAVF
ncbi:fibronectin type III domain-containing protein [Nocardioides panzhihuensis]|uniref:Chitodextrinase n=1 Tax=Nocardioides panzhihuensis TaxID=860243 RepID=A0A7Z0DQT3_9ACTN|nr:fibronectin type III domain-containing protein [Nocardioides panzhihuensis]NYI79677.1 chitodextrinase [Nocardioides panzhihuensis]